MISFQDLTSAVQAIGLVVAFSYYILTIRNANKTRQAQLFMQIYNIFNTEKFMDYTTQLVSMKWDDYDDYMKKYGPTTNPKAFQAMGSMAGYLEGIGIMVNKGLLDISLVENLMARHIVGWWEKMHTITEAYRLRFKRPDIDIWTEYLYNEIKKREEKRLATMK